MLSLPSLSNALFLFDYDGTLCPHHEVWEQRDYSPHEILLVLDELSRAGAQVLWNTGRQVKSLGGLEAAYLKYSGYFIQGSVCWDSQGKKEELLSGTLPEPILSHYEDFVKKYPVYRLEIKPTALRLAPTRIEELSPLGKLLDQDSALLSEHRGIGAQTWRWVVGHRGAELLPQGFDKGSALKIAVQDYQKKKSQAPFVIALGDDVLDRPAAEAALESGGIFIAVGSSCGWVTQLKHKSEQLHYFDHPNQLLRALRDCI